MAYWLDQILEVSIKRLSATEWFLWYLLRRLVTVLTDLDPLQIVHCSNSTAKRATSEGEENRAHGKADFFSLGALALFMSASAISLGEAGRAYPEARPQNHYGQKD